MNKLDFTPIPQDVDFVRGQSWQFPFRLPTEVTGINFNDYTIKAYIFLNNSIIETLVSPGNITIANDGRSFVVKKDWLAGNDGSVIPQLVTGTLTVQVVVTDSNGKDSIPAYFKVTVKDEPDDNALRANWDTHYEINVIDGVFYLLRTNSLYNLTVEKAEEAEQSATLAGQKATIATTKAGEAEQSATTASTAATTASTKRDEAEGFATTASTKRNEAEGFATSAGQSATTATTKATEAAASASFLGEFFLEIEEQGDFLGDVDGYVFLQVTLVDGLKTAYDIANYTDEDVSTLLYEKFGMIESDEDAIVDEEGYVSFEFTEEGVNYPDKLGKSQLEAEMIERYSILPDFPGQDIAGDIDGYVVFEVTEEGLQTANDNSTTIVSADKPKPKLPAIYCLLSEQGQSLSNSGASAVAVDMYNIKTFAGGINTSYDPNIAGAADAYFGTGLVPCATSGTETQMKRLARVWKDLLRDENGIAISEQEVTFVINSAGAGGISLSAIADKTGIYYRRTLEAMRRLRDFAIAEGKTANCPVFVYVQGENSADKADSIATHYAKLESLFDNLNADAKAIFNQQNDMQFIIYQIASFPQNPPATVNVPLAQLKIALEKTNVHFGCAMYQIDYADALHGTTVTYQKMGGLMGVVAKRIISDEVKMKPIYPKSWTIQSNTAGTLYTLAVRFDVPVEPLVFDTSVNYLYLSVPSNYGFSILSAGVEIIQSASIEYGNTIVFVCSQNPSGKELTYAIGGRDLGGNLRDSQGEAIKIPTDAGMFPAHNWAPIFKIVI